MTFSCRNYDFDLDNCAMLKTDCIPGRPGCVLVGKVKFSEEITKRLENLKKEKEYRRLPRKKR